MFKNSILSTVSGLIEAELGFKRFDEAKEIVNSLDEDLKKDKNLKEVIEKIEVSEKDHESYIS